MTNPSVLHALSANSWMEFVVTIQLMGFVEENGIFTLNQHRFWNNKGCGAQLVELVSDISAGYPDKIPACVIDFLKDNHSKWL